LLVCYYLRMGKINNYTIQKLQPYILSNELIQSYLKDLDQNANSDNNTKHKNQTIQENTNLNINPFPHPINNNTFKKHIVNTNSNLNSKINRTNKFDNDKPMWEKKEKEERRSLFWWFYILSHSMDEFNQIRPNQLFTFAQEERYRLIDVLRANKHVLKMHKINKFNEIESNLGCEPDLTLKTFMALCIVHGISIDIVDRKFMYTCECEDNSDEYYNTPTPESITKFKMITRINGGNMYSIKKSVTERERTENINTLLCTSGWEIKLKSIGGYSRSELLDICKRLDIFEFGTSTKTKPELHASIVSCLQPMMQDKPRNKKNNK
jgi:hypothetical protein